jgi:predicted nucleic acid-binding Zn ribbon protein
VADDDFTIPCPYCKADIFEDSVRCPRCGNYLSSEDKPAQPLPLWLLIGVVACLIIVALWMGLGRLL